MTNKAVIAALIACLAGCSRGTQADVGKGAEVDYTTEKTEVTRVQGRYGNVPRAEQQQSAAPLAEKCPRNPRASSRMRARAGKKPSPTRRAKRPSVRR